MTYLLIVAGGAIGVLLLYRLASRIHEACEMRRLRALDRSIPLDVAIDRTRRGEGFFVIEKNGHSTVWWVQGPVIANPFELHNTVRRAGMLVKPQPADSDWRLLQQEGLANAIRELTGLFMVDK